MNVKYYTPSIEEFHVGFEYEYDKYDQDLMGGTGGNKYIKEIYNKSAFMYNTYELDQLDLSRVRVKYLDSEDIESLGFSRNIWGEIPSLNYYKLNGNEVFQITEYWSYEKLNRNNLIRIYTGMQHQYPYTEVFRGEIKNKSELKKLLKQLNIE